MSFTSMPPISAVIDVLNVRPEVPIDVWEFLVRLKWSNANCTHPVTKEPLLYKNYKGQSMYCTWSEAVSFEFFSFMSMDYTAGKKNE